ncbi:DUF2889 domain-containing protein [Syntrophomonas wolfei]|uniref:DUF2889 domain-containing protein n=1 Tax=Syntrophomonas wolfei TaxID=863 RepID=UPI0023F2161A|nr:DUF2889 domain-containing protein [Syntrophomonas wolfei]
MEFLFQRFWHSFVERLDEKYIIARTTYLDTGMEREIVLRIEAESLDIEEAWLLRLGRPGMMADSCEELQVLKGIKAYLGSGPELRQALRSVEDELLRSLVNDTVIAVVQAESFLYRERGYNDAAQYTRAWEEFYLGSCRYYSNLERVKVSWGDFIGAFSRETRLFDRCKTQQLFREDNGTYRINGSIIDSFHHMTACLELDQDMTLSQAWADMTRVPDKVCRESTGQLANIIGHTLAGKPKKELARLLGAGQGCVHLIDLLYDSARMLELYMLDVG